MSSDILVKPKKREIPLFKRMEAEAAKMELETEKAKLDGYLRTKIKKKRLESTQDEIKEHMQSHDKMVEERKKVTVERVLLTKLKHVPEAVLNSRYEIALIYLLTYLLTHSLTNSLTH